MKPRNDFSEVQKLAADEVNCTFFKVVLDSLRSFGLDSDDLLAIIASELGEVHCIKSAPTMSYYPQTISDYFSIWIEECSCRMFIKLLVADTPEGRCLVVTSFKKDRNYE